MGSSRAGHRNKNPRTGLGTRIVKDAIDAHGGHIEVGSAGGAVTTFRIFLPLGALTATAR